MVSELTLKVYGSEIVSGLTLIVYGQTGIDSKVLLNW